MIKCKEIEKLVPDYLEGGLCERDLKRVEEHLASCEECRIQVEGIKRVWSGLERIELKEPSVNLEYNFQHMLDGFSPDKKRKPAGPGSKSFSEMIKSFWPAGPLAQCALCLIMLIAGLVTGLEIGTKSESEREIIQLKTDMNDMKTLVMGSLLNQTSATERINGLYMTGRLEKVDEQFYSTLLLLLNSDSNVNVRLAAVNALSNFAENEYVRHELIKSLNLQSSPLVQISLIDLLSSIEEANSSSTLLRIINDPGANEHVKKRAEKALKQFI